ncbi:MAG TPA: MoxR family ATPase [Candidatus Krumholzibacteria bacterium]|nr:MoxR family ATPase [Candidatus Krumholzibacteria bacterium]
MSQDLNQLQERIEGESDFVRELQNEIGRVVVGQRGMVDALLIGLLTGGHVLLEGVPGLAKTLSVSTLARALAMSFARIQFTPDLLPADLIGTLIYDQRNGDFVTRKGPIFANVILADEINRAPAKVQSALLEAMQEMQITIGDETFPLDQPFLVLATQNPIEQEGTYPLPEAQVDRFMLKAIVDYPQREEERKILDRMLDGDEIEVSAVLERERLLRAREIVKEVYVDDKIREYVLDLVRATREPAEYDLSVAPLIAYGASPRATLFLTRAARAHAFLRGRGFVTPEDVKSIGPLVMRHRVSISYEAEAEELTSDDIVRLVFDHVEVP